jgi:hypothetical protein
MLLVLAMFQWFDPAQKDFADRLQNRFSPGVITCAGFLIPAKRLGEAITPIQSNRRPT